MITTTETVGDGATARILQFRAVGDRGRSPQVVWMDVVVDQAIANGAVLAGLAWASVNCITLH